MAAAQLFDREVFFDLVRVNPFGGVLEQHQVDGMSAILAAWERPPLSDDLRFLAYPLATTRHETDGKMWPISEYGGGAGKPYGVPDPETGQTYFGRGFVQLTWRENYARADRELGYSGERSLEWHADNALKLDVAAEVMFEGMAEGWFRTHEDGKPETLERYFGDDIDDPFNAREIINGDKNYTKGGTKIGALIAADHEAFLAALEASAMHAEELQGEPAEPAEVVIEITITATGPVKINVGTARK